MENYISIDSSSENFIKKEISAGKYNSPSEVVNKALKFLEQEELRLNKLRNELEIGEQSGVAEDFDPDTFIQELHDKYL